MVHQSMYRQWGTCYTLSRNSLFIVQAMERAPKFAGIVIDLSIKEGAFKEQLKYLDAAQHLNDKIQVCQAHIDPNDMGPGYGGDMNDIPMTGSVEYRHEMEVCYDKVDAFAANLRSSTLTGFGLSVSSRSTFGSSKTTSTETFACSTMSWATASTSSGGLSNSSLGTNYKSYPAASHNITTSHLIIL
jgi:hypothetical protein